MPSLIGADAGSGVNVAANYLAMPAQHTYGTGFGNLYSNFGTRNFRFVKVVLSGGTVPDLSATYTAANSLFSKAVRALSNSAEVYFLGVPSATAFVAAIADDTANGADSGNTQGTGFGLLEADILAATGSWASGVVTISSLTATGASIA